MEGLRERKKRLAREALASTALDLFLAEGFDRTTVRRIAEVAGTSPRTFHRYFRAKEDVVFGDLDAYGDSFEARLAERPPDEPPFDALCNAVVAVCAEIEASEDRRDIVLKRMRLAERSPAVRDRQLQAVGRWAEQLARRVAIRDGRRRPRMDELALAHAATGILHHSGRAWAAGDGRRGLAARVEGGFGELRWAFRPEGR